MMPKGGEGTGDAAQVRRCLAAATKQIAKALAYAQPQATTAADFVKMRSLRRELGEKLKAFDERHTFRKL